MDQARARRLLEDQAERLRAMRDEVVSERQRGGGPRETTETDQRGADAAAETVAREIDQSVAGHADSELGEIQAAMDRLDDGSYGVCQQCGRPIPDERLEARPATRFCVEHQELDENRAGVPGDRAEADPTASTTTGDRPTG